MRTLHNFSEFLVLHSRAGNFRHIGHGCIVILVLQAVRIHKICVFEFKCLCLLIHPRDKLVNRSADALRNTHRRVVSRRNQQTL